MRLDVGDPQRRGVSASSRPSHRGLAVLGELSGDPTSHYQGSQSTSSDLDRKPGHFTSEPADEIDPSEVAQDPRFTLYCLDHENDTAIFVEVDDPEAVDQAPFYYQGQIQHAIGLVSMPLEIFHKQAGHIPDPPKGLIFVHSVGRCGSTLLSKVLEAVPTVHSLSEPDDISQMVNLRTAGAVLDAQLKELLSSSVKWRCKPRSGKPADHVAIKPRSEVMVLADLFGACFPHANHLFLYRDAVSWMRTIFRGFPEDRDVYDEDRNRKMEESWSQTLPIVKEIRREDVPMNPVQIRILGWITCMEGYLRLAEMGVPACAARFEDLTSEPIPILDRFFSFCDVSDVDWGLIQGVLGRDSQAGTIYDREERRKYIRELTDELVQDVHDLIATRPLLQTPGVILPHTLHGPIVGT